MNLWAKVLWACIFFFFYLLPASADESVEVLLQTYDSASAKQKQGIEIVLEANAGGLSWANSYLQVVRKQPALFCFTPQAQAQTGADLIAMLRRDSVANEKVRKVDYGFAILVGLMRDYPCPAKSD